MGSHSSYNRHEPFSNKPERHHVSGNQAPQGKGKQDTMLQLSGELGVRKERKEKEP